MSGTDIARRLALLVDAENMKPEYLRQVLPEVFKIGRPVIQYAYGDFSTGAAKPWVEFLRENVIEARQVTAVKSGKNAADIALVVDAMELALRKKCDTFCILSSDRDFVALTTFLKREGIDAYGFGKADTDKKYRQSCAKFFEVKDSPAPSAQPAKPVAKEAPLNADGTVKVSGPNWPAILQEIARLSPSGGWVSLQSLGVVLGKRGIRAEDHGGANWGRVLANVEGMETRKDATGRRSVRIVAVKAAA